MSDIRLVQEWLNYSHNDLISARHLFENLFRIGLKGNSITAENLFNAL